MCLFWARKRRTVHQQTIAMKSGLHTGLQRRWWRCLWWWYTNKQQPWNLVYLACREGGEEVCGKLQAWGWHVTHTAGVLLLFFTHMTLETGTWFDKCHWDDILQGYCCNVGAMSRRVPMGWHAMRQLPIIWQCCERWQLNDNCLMLCEMWIGKNHLLLCVMSLGDSCLLLSNTVNLCL